MHGSAFDRQRSGDQWWKRMPKAGANPVGDAPPGFVDWRRWGSIRSIEVTFAAVGDNHVIEVPQLIDAKFYHPIGWLVAAHLAQGSPGGLLDTYNALLDISYGLGSASFKQLLAAGSLGPLVPGPAVNVFGPFPAETIVARGGIDVMPNPAGVFPRTNVFTLGAFVSPQVWP